MNEPFNGQPGGSPNAGWERATIEKLLFAQLKEQQAARRWRLAMRLLWLAVFGALAWAIWHADQFEAPVSTPHRAAPAHAPNMLPARTFIAELPGTEKACLSA